MLYTHAILMHELALLNLDRYWRHSMITCFNLCNEIRPLLPRLLFETNPYLRPLKHIYEPYSIKFP